MTEDRPETAGGGTATGGVTKSRPAMRAGGITPRKMFESHMFVGEILCITCSDLCVLNAPYYVGNEIFNF